MLTLLKDNFVTSTNFHSVSDNDYYILRGYQDDLYYTVLYIKDFEPNRDVIKELEKIKIKYNIQLFQKNNEEDLLTDTDNYLYEFKDLINETNKKIELDNHNSYNTYYLVFKERSIEKIKSSIIMTISLLKSLDFTFQDKDEVKGFISAYNGKNYESVGKSNKGLRLTTKRKSAFYFNPYSEEQTTWINLVTGIKNDKNKSLFLNNLNFKYFINSSYNKFPLLGIVSKDSSSLGFIETIENSVKDSSLLYVGKYKLTDNNFYINPFDTIIGYDSPEGLELNLIKNFVNLIFGAKETDYKELDNIIEQLYKNKKYCNTNEYREIKHELAKLKIYNEELSWRTIRNIFADAKNTRLAYFAHKKSMPTIADLLSLVEQRKKKNNSDMDYYEIEKNIKELMESYPFLLKSTTVDIEDKEKITMFDLDLDNTIKYKDIIYLAAASHIYKKYMYNIADVYGFNKNVNEGCIEIIKDKRLKEIPRRIILDDIDLMKVNNQLNIILEDSFTLMAREARKYCVDMTYVMDANINSTIVSFFTSVFSFSKDSAIMECIDMRLDEKENNTYSLSNSKTIPLYIWLDTKHGRKSNILALNVTSKEYWATTPVKEEIELRKKCYDLYKGEKAREILSLTYPDGLTSLIKNDLYDEKHAFQEILKIE